MQSLLVPDRDGRIANVALGFPELEHYVLNFSGQPWPAPGGSGETFFGAIVGRYANRIGGASFTLDGVRYELPANNGPNTMHGGPGAWSTKLWRSIGVSSEGPPSLALTCVEPDGYNGFPGAVEAEVRYSLADGCALRIDYRARSDKPTVINLTNHTYFNLAGESSGDVFAQRLRIDADRFLPINRNLIPTGQFEPVAGTPFDFREPKPIGRDLRRTDMRAGEQLAIARGYDHNWVLNGSGFRLAAVAEDPASGRGLEVHTTEPGLQFYTGNFLVGDLVGTGGRAYRQGDGFALETQHFPDTPHHGDDPEWPSVVLRPGEEFSSTTIYRFFVDGGGLPG